MHDEPPELLLGERLHTSDLSKQNCLGSVPAELIRGGNMVTTVNERAFEISCSGQFRRMDYLRKQLEKEGHN